MREDEGREREREEGDGRRAAKFMHIDKISNKLSRLISSMIGPHM